MIYLTVEHGFFTVLKLDFCCLQIYVPVFSCDEA